MNRFDDLRVDVPFRRRAAKQKDVSDARNVSAAVAVGEGAKQRVCLRQAMPSTLQSLPSGTLFKTRPTAAEAIK